MPETLKFFSPQWCVEMAQIANADDQMYRGLHDAKTFTNHMHFGLVERPEVAIHVDWEQGKIANAAPARYGESDLWAMLNAHPDTWRLCAEGASASTLLMAGKVKLAKGPMTAAIQNAKALDRFVNLWGRIPTDWAV